MPFKIVETIRKGTLRPTICPSGWETGGRLSWPKIKGEKLIKSEHSLPEPDWFQMDCIIKSTNIKSYHDAEQELNVMIYPSGSDTEPDDDISNHASDEELDNITKKVPNENYNSSTASRNKSQRLENITETPIEASSQSDSGSTMANIKLLFKNQNVIIMNQKKIMNKLEEMSTKLENIFTITDVISNLNDRSIGSAEVSKFQFKPIKDLTELEEFEELLADPNKHSEYKQRYSVICSSGKGQNCAYQLSDFFFSREFLTRCSWSGRARGDESKICLKSFTNTLQLFFELVHDRDKNYTIQDNEFFFKVILKNATKRNESKCQRASTVRNRKRQKRSDIIEVDVTEDCSIDMKYEDENRD